MIKIKYIILLLVPAILLAQGSFRRQKIDRVAVSTESQITMEDTVRLDTLTGDTVPFLNASKDLTSSSVTPTELGYVSGVTGPIQTQIDGKEPTLTKGDLTETGSSILTVTGGTGAVIGSGVTLEVQQASSLASGYLTSADWSLFNGKQDTISGTANEIDVIGNVVSIVDNPVFSGLESVTLPAGADGDRPASPVNGMIRYNTTSSSFEGYQAGAWGELGGGGGVGGSRLQLISDPSFEEGVTEGSCTGCTATQDTTDKLGTDNNLASLKMAFSAASGNYTLTKSTSAQYSNVAGVVSAWIKTSASDCHFDELVDGTQSQTVAIGSSDEWKQYIINGTTGTTSYGWRVRCDTSITDDVFVDETFAGAAEPDTFDIGTASLWGSVKWDTTTNCAWQNSTTGAWNNFSTDADCDDNARAIKGQYNSTSGDAANSDGQTPQIKFSYIPAGVLRCEAKGWFYNTGANNVNWRFSDGTNVTSSNSTYGPSTASAVPVIVGEFNYTTPQTSETTIQIQSYPNANTADILVSSTARELEISCYHYPSPQKVVAAKCDGLECENEFSADVTSADVVSNENVDWIDGNCTDATTGFATCTFKSGLFTVAPSCQVTGDQGNNLATIDGSASTTSVRVRTQAANSTTDTDLGFTIFCQRSGSDYKQFDSRFIPVVDDTDVFVSGESSAGTSLTDGVTPIDFTETEDKTNSWDGSTFTAPSTGKYHFSGGVELTAAANRFVSAYLSTNGGASYTHHKSMAHFNASNTIIKFEGILELNANDKIQIRLNGGSSTTGTNTVYHWIKIRRTKDSLKAFIGNLSPKEFVQSTGASSPRLYSAEIGNTGTVTNEVGNFINGNCTNANPSVCTFETTAFNGNTPNCTVSYSNAANCECHIDTKSSTTVGIKCTVSSTAGACAVNADLICHGVQ